MSPTIAEVLLQSPLPQLDRRFDYQIPDILVDSARVGQRVKVPFGRGKRLLDGFITAIKDTTDFDGELAQLAKIVSPLQILTPAILDLAERVAARQAGTTSDVLRLALPPRVARVEKSVLEKTEREQSTGLPTTPSHEPLRHPPRRITQQPDVGMRDINGESVPAWAAQLATEAVQRSAQGQRSMLIVPDYRDLAALETALTALGPSTFMRLDAQQSPDTRYRTYLRILLGEVDIVIGNRAAAYAPLPELHWIGIWDDGDPLYAEPLAPYANTRDVVLLRQQLSNCDLTFFAHSRSVAVERLLRIGWIHESVSARGPHVIALDEVQHDTAIHGIDSLAVETLRTAVRDGPVLVQVPRRGYATIIMCRQCQTPMRCPLCSGPLYQPHRGAPPTCRWCSHTFRDLVCPVDVQHELMPVGTGSERAVEDIARLVPGIKIVQATGDDVVQRVDSNAQLVIATPGAEPLASVGYRAILILDAHKALLRESLDATEQALRQWMNTAALAADDANVLIQGVTGPLARALATWRPEVVMHRELDERTALRYPPVVRFAVLQGISGLLAMAWEHLVEAVPDAQSRGIDRIGPVPIDDTLAQLIVRVPYPVAPQVAAVLKRQIVEAALRGNEHLRVRFDATDL